MITSLILTIVVLAVLGLGLAYLSPPIPNALVQWAVRAIMVLIAIVVILNIWGIGI